MADQLSFHVQRYFLTYLVKQHNYGGNTIASYRDTFRLFLMFMDKAGVDVSKLKVADVDHNNIAAFLDWLHEERNNGVSTRNVRLAHMKSFFRYIMMAAPEYSDQCSKIINIPFAKEVKRPPNCLSTDAIKSLLAAVDSTTDGGMRHLAIMSLMYDSGCRVQELIDLDVSDFQAGQCSRIYVHGKGNKYRAIPLLRETERIVSKYIKRYGLTPESPLFTNKRGDRLTRQGIRHIIKKYSNMVNMENPDLIDGTVYPHLLRHSKASHLVDGGVNIYNVRDFLGHESIATTQVYLTANPETTRKAIETVAAKTVPKSLGFFSDEEKNDLLSFLDSLG